MIDRDPLGCWVTGCVASVLLALGFWAPVVGIGLWLWRIR